MQQDLRDRHGVALGAFAVGYLVIGRLRVRTARIGRLEIDELVVRNRRDASPDED